MSFISKVLLVLANHSRAHRPLARRLPVGQGDFLVPPVLPDVELSKARERAMKVERKTLPVPVAVRATDSHAPPKDRTDAPLARFQMLREPHGERRHPHVHRSGARPFRGGLAFWSELDAANFEAEPNLLADCREGWIPLLSEHYRLLQIQPTVQRIVDGDVARFHLRQGTRGLGGAGRRNTMAQHQKRGHGVRYGHDDSWVASFWAGAPMNAIYHSSIPKSQPTLWSDSLGRFLVTVVPCRQSGENVFDEV